MQEFEVSPEQAREWRDREEVRMNDGTYTRLPNSWRDMRWYYTDDTYNHIRYPDHYAHISIDKVSMIAFTENEQKGVRDRQTRMSPGKYLSRFFSDVLTPLEIQRLATELGASYNADAELHFAVTDDEFEEVYTTGPRSCMSHEPSFFNSCVHPVRVYAGHDLQLAYIKREGRITARTLVWPDKLRYSRVYGDAVRLTHMLGQIGYKEGTLSGAKITRVMDGDEYVIPYLDHLCGAVDKGTHLLLSDGSHNGCDIASDRQNGLSGDRVQCYECGESLNEDDARGDGDHNYCDSCYNDRYGFCQRTEESVPRDEIEEVRTARRTNGNWRTQEWGEYARNEHAFYCEADMVWYSDSFDQAEIRGQTWGPDAIENNAVMCEGTDEYVHIDDSVTLEDGTVWSKAHFDRYGVTIDGELYDQDNLPDGEEAPVRKPSPTVVCAAQIEAPLGLHVVVVPGSTSNRWRVMDGATVAYDYDYYCKHNAEDKLRVMLAERASQPIVVGCMVECLTDSEGEFTRGKLYKVTRVYVDHDRERIMIERDDADCLVNGWNMENFRFHSMPPQQDRTGLHIRHEPQRTYPYLVYNGDSLYNFYSSEDAAQICLDELIGHDRQTHSFHTQPEEVA
jgi:hypothetical protein